MKKAFVGVRLRRLREERGLTPAALARALGLSPSYLNQLERNQRPLTVALLLKLNAVFGIDVQRFSGDEEARLLTDLRAVASEQALGDVALAELREIAANMPTVARAILAMHRRSRESGQRADLLAARLGVDGGMLASPEPFEEVRDYFYDRHNHIAELDTAAEELCAIARLPVGNMVQGLVDHLLAAHGVRAMPHERAASGLPLRSYDKASRTLRLSPLLRPGQQAFQLATQLAFLELGSAIDRLVDEAEFSGPEARQLARIGLANYFAGAVVLPYGPFLEAAEEHRYDVEALGHRFGVGFETVCHRLSTLQRPGAPGVPFFFIRVDRAGNISKRQSATDFHFSRIGGTCPLWNIYSAFARPGEVLTQLARMPDGRTYLWIARTVVRGQGGYGAPSKVFAVALGCDVRHAGRLVYSKGLDLDDPTAAIPIGAGCRICERPACPQRAFPSSGRALTIDENRIGFAPYSAT